MDDDDDIDVIFKGSALHDHLEHLGMLDEEEDILCPTRLSENNDTLSVKGHTRNNWLLRLHSYFWKRIWFLFNLLTRRKHIEQQLLYHWAMFLCSRNLISPDDRLYLFHFSPVFAHLLDNPKIIESYTEEVPLIFISPLKLYNLNIYFVLASVLAVLSCLINSQFTIPVTLMISSVVMIVLSVYILKYIVAWKTRRSYQKSMKFFCLLADIIYKAVPASLAVISESNLVTSSIGASKCSGKNTRVEQILQQSNVLQEVVFNILSTVSNILRALQQKNNEVPSVPLSSCVYARQRRRELEEELSCVLKNIQLDAERAYEDGEQSILNVIHAQKSKYIISEHQMKLENNIDLIKKHVEYLKQLWVNTSTRNEMASIDCKPHQSRESQQQIVLDSLKLNIKMIMCLVEECEAENSYVHGGTPDDENLNKFKLRERYAAQLKVIEDVMQRVKGLQQDCDVFHEMLVRSETSLCKELKIQQSQVQSHDTDSSLAIDKEVSGDEPLKEVVPFVAQDEFLEGVPDADDDVIGKEAEESWWVELQKEEQARKLLRAQNRRVLSELQPILIKKKEEFQTREKIAKQRMVSDKIGSTIQELVSCNEQSQDVPIALDANNKSNKTVFGSSSAGTEHRFCGLNCLAHNLLTSGKHLFCIPCQGGDATTIFTIVSSDKCSSLSARNSSLVFVPMFHLTVPMCLQSFLQQEPLLSKLLKVTVLSLDSSRDSNDSSMFEALNLHHCSRVDISDLSFDTSLPSYINALLSANEKCVYEPVHVNENVIQAARVSFMTVCPDEYRSQLSLITYNKDSCNCVTLLCSYAVCSSDSSGLLNSEQLINNNFTGTDDKTDDQKTEYYFNGEFELRDSQYRTNFSPKFQKSAVEFCNNVSDEENSSDINSNGCDSKLLSKDVCYESHSGDELCSDDDGEEQTLRSRFNFPDRKSLTGGNAGFFSMLASEAVNEANKFSLKETLIGGVGESEEFGELDVNDNELEES